MRALRSSQGQNQREQDCCPSSRISLPLRDQPSPMNYFALQVWQQQNSYAHAHYILLPKAWHAYYYADVTRILKLIHIKKLLFIIHSTTKIVLKF